MVQCKNELRSQPDCAQEVAVHPLLIQVQTVYFRNVCTMHTETITAHACYNRSTCNILPDITDHSYCLICSAHIIPVTNSAFNGPAYNKLSATRDKILHKFCPDGACIEHTVLQQCVCACGSALNYFQPLALGAKIYFFRE